MLEGAPTGPVDLVLRARSEQEAPLRDEVRELAKQHGATVHEVFGSRGFGWASAAQPTTLAQLVPDLDDHLPDGPLHRRLQGAGDLVGVDVQHVVALGDRVALRDVDLDDLAGGHREAPLGHRDGLDLVHGKDPLVVISRHSRPPSSPPRRCAWRPG